MLSAVIQEVISEQFAVLIIPTHTKTPPTE